MTYIINFVGPPCAGKSLLAAKTFVELKKSGIKTELVQEHAKKVIADGKCYKLDNQVEVSRQQHKDIKRYTNTSQIVVTDGSLLHGLFYNTYNENSLCAGELAKQKILDLYNDPAFENIVVFVEKGNYPYDTVGRVHTEEQSAEISVKMRAMLVEHNIDFVDFKNTRSHRGFDELIEDIIDLVEPRTFCLR